MKTITRDEYDQIMFYKSMNDQMQRMGNRLYYYAKKVLGTEDDNWLTDYFYNDDLSVTELLTHLDIDIAKDKSE